jgi:uncharacterized protein DUF2867
VRVSNTEHQSRPWAIERVAPDFPLLDAWRLPIAGRREDFDLAVRLLKSLDPVRCAPAPTRALFKLRFWIGARLGWDDVRSQRPGIAGMFTELYHTDVEWAAKTSNSTVHGILQLGWLEQPDGSWRGQLGVYVKPRGLLGRVYLLLIAPFRHLIVYPQLFKMLAAEWRSTVGTAATLA